MSKKLWEASIQQKKNSNLFKFEKFISKKFKKKFHQNYSKILKWSIKNSPDFWNSFWDFSQIKGIKGKK
jgi:acetoacetyl-CoA synthetase